MAAVPSHSVLLCAAGTGIAFATVTALRKHWGGDIKIVVADTMPRHLATSSLQADACEHVPPITDASFQDRLLEIIEEHQIETYLPLPPEEIAITAFLRGDGDFPSSLKIIAASNEVEEIVCDKYLTSLWLERHGLPSPCTALATEPFAAGRYFFKPRHGKGSLGAHVLSAQELGQLDEATLAEGVVQEICAGPEVTVDVFFDDRTGFVVCLCRERLEVRVGVTVKARVFHDPALEEIARQLATRLPLPGTFCFQAMRCRGQWAVTDINPRPGAATAMSVAVGHDFFAATFALAWGEETARFFRPLEREVFITRQYCEFVMN